ncbi:E3 ubiquitin- ligase LNX [Schistosoma japonicum]|uniref:E3 ubiquitin-ligase LNX n=1 Tax=Schistosoma japonicum TaxID=6182 RepID=A0A4Z2DMY8_SCHJA|nr:E3 ubiquitin- ligase LNX [Schistosoma japonicum]
MVTAVTNVCRKRYLFRLSNTTTIAICDSSTPKSSKVACDASVSNLFSNPPSFEPPNLPYSYSENISPGLLNCPLNPATSTPSSFLLLDQPSQNFIAKSIHAINLYSLSIVPLMSP